MAFSFTVSTRALIAPAANLPVLGEPRQEPPPQAPELALGVMLGNRVDRLSRGNVERRSERLPHDTVHAEVLGVHRGGLRLDEAGAHARIVAR